MSTRLLPPLHAGTRDYFVFLGTNGHSISVPGRDVNNDKVVRCVYEDLLRYRGVKPDPPWQRYGYGA